MTRDDMRIVTRALAKYRDSDASVSLGSAVAMITCDISDEFRANDPSFEYLEFWNMVEDARRVYRQQYAEWLKGARERMAK